MPFTDITIAVAGESETNRKFEYPTTPRREIREKFSGLHLNVNKAEAPRKVAFR